MCAVGRFRTLGEKKLYRKAFDSSSESEPIFPTDLLDKDGPWVTYSSEREPSAGGLAHMDRVNHRSVFTLHLRTPDGHDGGVKFLKDFTKTEGRQAVPPGTTLALLRRALVPTRSEKLLVSPLVESLQLIAVKPILWKQFVSWLRKVWRNTPIPSLQRSGGVSWLLRRLPARVAADDHALGVDDDGLPETKGLQRRRHGVHGAIVDAGVLFVGFDASDGPEFNLHGNLTGECGTDMSMHLAEMARQIRNQTIVQLKAAPEGWLLWAPPGTSNHILWHAGHALWVQDALCVAPLTGGVHSRFAHHAESFFSG